MKDEKTIGKKVWLLIENKNGLQVAIDTGDWTIVAIKPFKEVKDYCNHLVVKNDKGVEQEVREYNAIFIPRPELQGDEQAKDGRKKYVLHFTIPNHPCGTAQVANRRRCRCR